MLWLHRLFELPAIPLLAFTSTIGLLLYIRNRVDRVISQPHPDIEPLPISGGEAAHQMLLSSGVVGICVEVCQAGIVNSYDPGIRVIHLANSGVHGHRLADLARAAHEVGHALQDTDGVFYPLVAARQMLTIMTRLLLPTSVLVIGAGFAFDIESVLELGFWILPAGAGLIALGSLILERDANFRARRAICMLGCLDASYMKPLETMLEAMAWSELTACLPRKVEGISGYFRSSK